MKKPDQGTFEHAGGFFLFFLFVQIMAMSL